ncbi:hypothetical protein I317_06715 [Kwoniella heveanensis CBS 569]|nr:hypothetical protein I317_06715 [Kwoniella heveanensis CBS 569]
MYDPQQLSFVGSVNALIALGRIPLASEVPLWTTFGCILAARLFPSTGAKGISSIDWWVIFQCAFITWATNVSINYGNEYFDWNLDRPGQIESIKRSIRERKKLEDTHGDGEQEVDKEELNEKIMGNTTRIIHDGTFPPYTALLLGAAWQAAVVGLILYSRSNDGSPFRGFPLQVGIISSILSQMYVGPPIRLHYHGLGEGISALLLNPVAALFGMTGYYTATTGRIVQLSDILSSTSSSGFSLGPIWNLLAALYCFEQARIFIMHIQDIEADIAGGKITFVVRVGHRIASSLYVLFNIASFFLFQRFNHVCHRQLPSFYTGWLRGLTLVAAMTIPIVAITARSLFAQIPPARPLKQAQQGIIPILPLTVLPMIVSLQVLLSPLILSSAILLHW